MHVFATAHGNAVTVLQPGQGFTTPRLRLQTAEDVAHFGGQLEDAIDYEVNHPANALDLFAPVDLERYLIQRVDVAEPGPGQVETARRFSVGEGGAITCAVTFAVAPPPAVPSVVSRLRAMLVLDEAGLIPTIEAYMALPTTPSAHKIFWRETQDFHRDSELVAVIAAVINVGSAQLDTLFRRTLTII